MVYSVLARTMREPEPSQECPQVDVTRPALCGWTFEFFYNSSSDEDEASADEKPQEEFSPWMKVLLYDNLFHYTAVFVTYIDMQQLMWAAECKDYLSYDHQRCRGCQDDSVSSARSCVYRSVQSRGQLQSQLPAAMLVRLLSISRAYRWTRKYSTG